MFGSKISFLTTPTRFLLIRQVQYGPNAYSHLNWCNRNVSKCFVKPVAITHCHAEVLSDETNIIIHALPAHVFSDLFKIKSQTEDTIKT